MTHMAGFDMTGFSQRADGQWRTDAAQEGHERWLEQCRLNRELAEATAKRCAVDPLLKRIDSHLDRGGMNNWNERYLLIAAIDELCARHALSQAIGNKESGDE